MKVEVETIDGKILTLSDIRELCFTQTVNVACDSLWLIFFSKTVKGEIVYVRVFDNEDLIFNGICDCQKNIFNENGCEIRLYARSTASLLVDNEAEPYTYEKPSARQLCFSIAEKYGFSAQLENIFSDMKYEVVKGTSCFGAISHFVSLLTGQKIEITPKNEIKLLKISENIKRLNSFNIISLSHTINRSEPYSQILFKKNFSESGYNMHTESLLSKRLGIDRKIYINLSSLPQWQRQNTVLQKLKDSYESYKVLEAVISGYVGDSLLQRFSYYGEAENYEDYAITERKYIYDKNGERTRLVLKKMIDIGEITYVD